MNFKKKVERGRWDNQMKTQASGIMANAFYQHLENKIYLPSYTLDGWVFNSLRPQMLNIPSMCFLLAHEIFHGFDADGHNYNHEGLY